MRLRRPRPRPPARARDLGDDDREGRRGDPARLLFATVRRALSSSSGGAAVSPLTTTTTTTTDSGRDRASSDWRIARELARHVWPPLPDRVTAPGDIDDGRDSREGAMATRGRVVASVALMLAGKGITIATPFVFKALVDSLGSGYVPSTTFDSATTTTTTAAEGAARAGAEVVPLAPDALVDILLLSSPTLCGVPSLPALLVLSYGACRALSSLFNELRNAVFSRVSQSAIRSVGRSTFDHVHGLDIEYHLNRNTGALGRIIERGNQSMSTVLGAVVFNTVPTFIEVGIVTGCMYHQFGVGHAATVLATVAVYVGYTVGITTWRTQFRRDMNRLNQVASGKLSDSLLNYETVKYFNNEVHEGRAYEDTLRQYQDAAIRSQGSLSLLNFGQNAIFTTGLTAMMCLTAADVVTGNATVGDLVLVNGLLFQLSVPLNFIGGLYREVQQALIDMEAMFRLRDARPKIVDADGAIEYDPAAHGSAIEFDGLEFSYDAKTSSPRKKEGAGRGVVDAADDGGDGGRTAATAASAGSTTRRPILRGTTFSVPQGKTVAIVGTSGCGKSTLLRLLYRFYAPDSGTIRLGGNDVSAYTTRSVRRAMSVVPQDVVLFNDTIGYNIRYGDLSAPWDDVVDASRKAHLHDSIMRMPNGYDTVVGERGLKLSGGEKQRVSLARAILKRSPILLCDEPTSSLDSHTESEIMNNLKEVGRDTTCLIIAHRLSTIMDCDVIVVMDGGRVVERGTHDELMALEGGRYRELVAFQKSHNVEEERAEYATL
ncbi:hypothetical protein ACHAW5_006564 [Stephanodiscus triporus]|uniref:Uncharacterized protein n=1 Tax=Stephanodiscus triporus TaxID=2934178 RepID=A0ABD3PRH9_9STRA